MTDPAPLTNDEVESFFTKIKNHFAPAAPEAPAAPAAPAEPAVEEPSVADLQARLTKAEQDLAAVTTDRDNYKTNWERAYNDINALIQSGDPLKAPAAAVNTSADTGTSTSALTAPQPKTFEELEADGFY